MKKGDIAFLGFLIVVRTCFIDYNEYNIEMKCLL